MISVQNLVKDFGARRAVDDVSFEVKEGEVLGFLGPNGAGKSTTMRMITGFIPPSSGTAVVNGHDVVQDPVEAKRQIGYLPENAPAYGDMTVAEFLRFVAEMRGFTGAERGKKVDAAIEKCFLEGVRNQTFETLSKGYRQRTCFAQAILHNPPILILDEPTDGLDPNQKQVVRDMIGEMAQEKVIIFSTHVLEEVDAVCTRAIVISEGQVVADSSPEALRKRSKTYNGVTLNLVAPSDAAKAVFAAIADVASVDVQANGADQVTCRVVPRDQQPIASQVMAAAQKKNWLVTSVETDRGRLDDVFRDLTITEDVNREARKEA
jgi:ABC-2 type transport system ATP-binding protein